MNLASVLTDSAQRDPDHVALRLDDMEVSYGLLDEGSSRLAAVLADRGLKPGDRVGIMLPNVPYFGVCYYGVLRAGCVVVPMNVLLKRREVAFYLGDSGAKLMFGWEGFADDAKAGAEEAGAECVVVKPGEFEELLAGVEPRRDVVDRDRDDTAVILYTSGTTGTPKGAELTHENLKTNCEITRDMFGIGDEVVTLGALPLFHSFGQTCGMNATLAAGGTLSLIPRFDPGKALEIIERDKINLFQGVPTMYSALLHYQGHEKFDTATLQLCVSGGSAMPVELMRGFEDAFGCKILEGYGLSESSPVASFNRPDRERKPGSIGIPIEGVEMKVVDDDGNDVPQGEVGEIVIRGHNVMKGYWNKPEATAETLIDGWLHTGDMARIDEDGLIYIVDRAKDMINRGGENVYSLEVENALAGAPGVGEAAVIGVPDEMMGEKVGAVIVPAAGGEVDVAVVIAHVADEIADFKVPQYVAVRDEPLPRNPGGKVLKAQLRDDTDWGEQIRRPKKSA